MKTILKSLAVALVLGVVATSVHAATIQTTKGPRPGGSGPAAAASTAPHQGTCPVMKMNCAAMASSS
ncbi:MAG TPA: hypothetical protein VIM58_07720 [Candidatus Methylacidiphilales bacterium]